MPTTLTNGIQLPDKGSVDWYNSMQSNYNLIDTHLGNTDTHVTAEDKANWNSKQGSLSQAQLDAIAQVATNTSDIATLQSGKANASHTHSSSDITDIGDYATKQYVDSSISGLVDNAPDALNTLNELSAALNDDSNFASTVTTALAAKADSSDLATVATSGDYDDLSNKPSIPTNTSDLNNDSGFVTLNDFDIPAKTSDLTNDSGFITSSDVPTGTSDLINDSNFVDISNSAVASGITSAKVTSYDSHIADTNIHVTTADKSKWNNNVTQSYVFRYSSTALVASSTNSNTLLDNTDNLKVGDKVIDSDGVLFSITAIDTQNSTFTIGTALVDLAQDSNVVHKSGDETVAGVKRFTDDIIRGSVNTNSTIQARNLIGKTTVSTTGSDSSSYQSITATLNYGDSTPSKSVSVSLYVTEIAYSDGRYSAFRSNSNNTTNLGTSEKKWANVYATNYYYGSNNVEFSTKFVTTDTAQTISGAKTFSEDIVIGNSDTTQASKRLVLRSYKASLSGSNPDNWGINFNAGASYAVAINARKSTDGAQGLTYTVRTQDSNNNIFTSSYRFRVFIDGNSVLEPDVDNNVSLGRSTNRWKDVQTNLVNGLTPSSLSLPTDNIANIIDISGYLTVLDGSQANTYQAPDNGYIGITMSNCTGIQAYITGFWGNQIVRPTAGAIIFFMPICKNMTANILVFGGTVDNARFFPCQGNV